VWQGDQNEPQLVWSPADVKVSAIRSTHIAGHASSRVDTPAASVVIGGDAGNDTFAPPRSSSTSAQVETLAKGVDVIVHSTIHPVMGPDRNSFMPPPLFYRQPSAADLGAMAKRLGARSLVLTHLIPMIGAERHGIWKIQTGLCRKRNTGKSFRTADSREASSWRPISRLSAFPRISIHQLLLVSSSPSLRPALHVAAHAWD